jgi:hypothetical protein
MIVEAGDLDPDPACDVPQARPGIAIFREGVEGGLIDRLPGASPFTGPGVLGYGRHFSAWQR